MASVLEGIPEAGTKESNADYIGQFGGCFMKRRPLA